MYDTIVIGDDFSSLLAAVISARYGKKTILLSETDIPDMYADSGYTFNIDPLPLTGFGPDQTCSRIMSEIGILSEDCTDIHLSNPSLQIILADHRVELFHDLNQLFDEMEIEFPDELTDIRNFYTSLLKMSNLIDSWIRINPCISPKSYKHFLMLIRKLPEILKGRLSFSKMLRILQGNPSLNKLFESEFNLLSNLHTAGNSSFSLMSPYILSLPHRGLYYHAGGKGSLIKSLRASFAALGGALIKNVYTTNITPGTEIVIDTKSCEEIIKIRGENLIISTKSQIFEFLALNNKRFKRLKRLLKRVEKYYYPFTLHMGVMEKGIPERMAPYVAIVLEDNNKLLDIDNKIIFMEMSTPGDEGRAPTGRRALSATVFLKRSPKELGNFELEEIVNAIIENIEMFLPFLRENLDFLNMEASIELSRRYQAVLNQKYLIKAVPFLGMTSLSHKTPLKNIYLTGGMLLAGLGFEGEIISGMNAARSAISQEDTDYGTKTV